jgi:hypothetical protein
MDQLSHDSFNNLVANDGATPQREGARDSLLLAAKLRATGKREAVQVRVRNLSPGGLMAEYDGPIATGSPVEIEVRGIGWVAGHVAWSVNGRIGVAFDVEVDPLRARKPVGARR